MSGQWEKLYKVQQKEAARAGAVLADAFQHDPVWNSVFTEDMEIRRRRFAFETPVRYCLKYGKVYATSENLEGIAAWVPGRVSEMTLWRMIQSGAIASGMKMGTRVGRRMAPIFRPIERDRKAHMRGRPFLYLQVIGVASAHQGRGLGGQLLRAIIAESEEAGIPLYLETETEANVRWYEGHGFRTLTQITLPLIGLPMWEMVREPGS
jgi:ribosomal protein S18 acetylase RimI-like enzyme